MTKQVGDSNLIDTWAANGTLVDPETVNAGKTDTGWTSGERPPYQFFNWLLNLFGKKINYLMRSGVPAWNAVTAYLANDYVSYQGSLYRAVEDNTNQLPTTSKWVMVLAGQGQSGQTLTGNLQGSGYKAINLFGGVATFSPASGATVTLTRSQIEAARIICPGSGTIAIAANNFPANNYSRVMLEIVNGGNVAITWPSGVVAPTGLKTSGSDYFILQRDYGGGYVLFRSVPVS